MAAAYRLQSNNALNLTGSVTNYLNIGVAASAGCNDDDWSDRADAAAIAAGINPADFNYVSYQFNLASNPCGSFSGLGQVPGRYTWIYGVNNYNRSIISHEWGHNLGMGHANWMKCTDGNGASVSYSSTCVETAYGDYMTTMGIGLYNVLQLHNAVALDKLGWLASNRVATVNGSRTVTLNQLYSGSGVAVAKIARPNNKYLYIEYRTPQGPYDTQYAGGVMFHNELQAGNVTQVLGDTNGRRGMVAGQSFYDYQSGATITIASTNASTATLDISFAGQR